jgi:hypothetical protein
MLTSTWGGTSRMCFARDVLRCVMGVGVVCLILTSSWMENETCFLNFKQDEAFLAALMQKKGRSGYDLLVVLDLSVRTQIEISIRYILISILRRYHSLSQLHLYHPWRGTCYTMSFHYVMHIFWWSLSNIVYRRTVDARLRPALRNLSWQHVLCHGFADTGVLSV